MITSEQVYQEIEYFIPEENQLTKSESLSLIAGVISRLGDEDKNLPHIKCDSLKAIGLVNLSKATVASGGVQREQVGGESITWFSVDAAKRSWQDWMKSLDDICPLFGYYENKPTVGVKIQYNKPPRFPRCCSDPMSF